MDFSIYPLQRYDKNRLYIFFEDENGDRIRRSTGISYPKGASKKKREQAHKQAEEKGIALVLDHFKNHRQRQQEKEKAPLLSTYLEEYYLPDLRSNNAKSTYDRYKLAFDHLLRICGDLPLDDYDRQLISKYKLYRLNKDQVEKTTIDLELRSIKACFSWAEKHDFLVKNPYQGQDILYDAKKTKRAFTSTEIQKLLKYTEGKLIGLIVRLAYYTGMRIGEMNQLKWNMINLEERYIDIPPEITKTDKGRLFPLEKKAFNIIKIFELILKKKMNKAPEYYQDKTKDDCFVLPKERGHGQYARRSIQQKFRRTLRKIGLPDELKFHCLRHSFATHTLEKGGEMYKVSKLMGHSSTKVTSDFYDHTDSLSFRETAGLL
jgi:integrase/recombinase XerD